MVRQVESDKIIREWGTSLVIILDKQDLEMLDAKVGDKIKMKIIKMENGKENL